MYFTISPNKKFAGKSLDYYGVHSVDTYKNYLKRCVRSKMSAVMSESEYNKKTKSIKYKWNQEGYRCDEFYKKSDFKTLVVGSSVSLGTGLKLEETYAYRFFKSIANQLGLSDFAFFNLSDGGATNAYITRSLIEYLDFLNPDLILIQFAEVWRYEYVDHEGNYLNAFKGYEDDLVMKQIKENFQKIRTIPVNNFDYYRELILVQELLKNKEKPYLITNLGSSFPAINCKEPYLQGMRRAIDFSKIFNVWMDHLDLAMDFRHAGPKSHEVFAEKMLNYFNEVYDVSLIFRNTKCRIGLL